MLSRTEQWHRAIVDLLQEANFSRPDELADLVRMVTSPLVRDYTIYLVDFDQQVLREFTPTGSGDAQPVMGSLAGLAFQRGNVQIDPADDRIAWIPLIDSTERLGVVRVAAELPHPASAFAVDEPDTQFANLVGHLIAAKMAYGDRLHQIRSSHAMSVESVLLRSLLPPTTFTDARAAISASLQPAYAAGGDGYDYAADGDVAYLAIFDGAGHGLHAGMTLAVALSATRAARRSGAGLVAIAAQADEALGREFGPPDFVTAILARLDLGTGTLEYVNAGHPPATVLCRDGSATTLDGGRRLPLGMDVEVPNVEVPAAGHVQLRRGDRVLLHTDGITDARNAAGEFYDSQRLIDHARLLHGEDETVPETARKLTQQVVDYHDGPPQDDLTVVVCEWSSTAAEEMLP